MLSSPDQSASDVSDVLCFDNTKTMVWPASDLHAIVLQHYRDAKLAEIFDSPWLLSTPQPCCPWLTLCLVGVIPGSISIDIPTPTLVPADKTLGSISVPHTLTIASTVHIHPKGYGTTSLHTFVQTKIKLRTRIV
jgi:hypothetical protein